MSKTDDWLETRPTPDRLADEALIIDVDGFEGPLDLLLNLSRTQKVDLRRISVLQLAEQYLKFVNQAVALRIELAADYLVMAAWLAYLKSRLLLPPDPADAGPSAEDLAAEISDLIEVIEWQDKEDILPKVFTVVNSTSLGMIGKPALDFDLTHVNPRALVADLIYAPLETQLLKGARARGCEVVGGIGMLLHQGVPGFEAWFGTRPVVDQELETLVLT